MEMLMSQLLRPYRSTYILSDLGPRRTKTYTRTDSRLTNRRGQQLHYSYYEHFNPSTVCLVYCHCNSGSRIQGVTYAKVALERRWNMCVFDFAGCGMSDGKHISLGHHETKDLEDVLRKVRSLGNRKLLLWGRSMGAATIILHLWQAKWREDIMGCVLDSPYASLCKLIKSIGASRSIVPGFILDGVISLLRDKIKEEHGFDIGKLEPLKRMSRIDMPVFFITSLMDEFVGSEEVVQMYKGAASKHKHLQYIDKAHHSARDQSTVLTAMSFLQKALNQKQSTRKQLKKIVLPTQPTPKPISATQLIMNVDRKRQITRRMKTEAFRPVDQEYDKENNSRIMNRHPHLRSQTPNVSCDIGRREMRRKIKFSLAHNQYSLSQHQSTTL